MPYDETLAKRSREQFNGRADVEEKKMFGGLCFMVSGHMCCGIVKNKLMARVGPDSYKESLAKKHVSKMNFTGRSMKEMVYIEQDVLLKEKELSEWLVLCIEYVESLPPKKGSILMSAHYNEWPCSDVKFFIKHRAG